jgi:type IV pilus assembly protein PilY1
MKTAVQLTASALALAGLLGGAASHATNLAELPLKASVLAKPNVIFGMDDSGSMDSEVMMYNNDGAFWWNYDDKTGWGVDAAHPNTALRTITSSWYNNVGSASTTWRKMVYLFPNGSSLGDRVYTDSQNDHFAMLPTRQFATLRWSGIYYDTVSSSYKAPPSDPALSPMHNPIYYNTLVNYEAWAPAQLSSGAVTPANATVTAAKSHPIYGTSTLDLTSNVAASQSSNFVFTALPGMRIPAGSKKNVCNSSNSGGCAGWTDVTADEDAATGKVTRVSMAYYPATFWVREACTPEASGVAIGSCVYVPGSTTVTLKRYEIKSGNTFPSGRTYAAEMQNFANWFQYYRKRKLMLAAAMGDTMENLTGMRLGVIAFNSLSGDVTMYDADATQATKNRLRVAGIFYEANGSGGTPTRETLKYIGDQYKRTDTDSSTGKYNMVQFACQRNNAFIVTDGFANNSSVSPPSWDSGKSAATWGTGAPYAQSFTHDGILADLALRYYTNNPRSDLATGTLQSTPRDGNTNLHMNTYGLALGARGTLFLGESTPEPTTAAAWPDPNTDRNPTSVDDLWHATINGRGKMYLANTPQETALRIQAGLDDIASLLGAQSGVAVSAVNLSRSDGRAYLGQYNQRGWVGDLVARAIDPSTAAITSTGDPLWSAATLLNARNWSTRVIFSSSGSTGVDFSAANVGATLNPDSASYTNQQVVEYVRGNRSGEGTLLRTRASLMGPVVNAEPVLAGDERMAYSASGEGMLHAFDTSTGQEMWAYVPPETLGEIGKSVQRGWVYRTLLDATPAYGRLSNGHKMLIGGLGAAGRSYYALDVTSPRDLDAASAAAQFRWTFPASTDSTNKALMGYTVGKPAFARVSLGGTLTDVVLVTSGYDNGSTIGDGKGRLWMLNASTGAVLKTFRTLYGSAGGSEAGLAHVAVFGEADGTIRYAFGGDLLGNVWRFDLQATGAGEIDAERLAVLKDGTGGSANTQPVTSKPELMYISGRRVVLVGTGRLLDVNDFGSSRVQSFYAIADGTELSNARSSLTARTYTRGANPELSGTAVNWATGRGWYLDLPAGEQVNTAPTIAYGAIIFVSNKSGSTDCSQQSYLYYMAASSGLVLTGPTSSTAAIGNVGSASLQLSPTTTSSRPVVVVDKNGLAHILTQGSGGNLGNNPYNPPGSIKPAKNAWREIRR